MVEQMLLDSIRDGRPAKFFRIGDGNTPLHIAAFLGQKRDR